MSSPKSGHLKILVIDDEDDLREIVSMTLTSRIGAQTIEAKSGNEGVSILKADDSIDMVVCDNQMADGPGHTVLLYLQGNRPTVPFILVSSDDPTKHEVFSKNIPTGYVQKPMIVEPLVILIKKMLPTLRPPSANNSPNETALAPGSSQKFGEIPPYCPIRIATLLKLKALPVDIFIKLRDGHFVKAMTRGETFEEKDLKRFQTKNLHTLYFLTKSANDVLRRYQKNIAEMLKKRRQELGTKISVEELAKEVMTPSIDLVRDMVTAFGWGDNISEIVTENINLAISTMQKEKSLSSLLERLAHTNNGDLASFCSSVAFVSCGIAQTLNGTSPTVNQQLTLACFLQEITLNQDQMINSRELIRKSGLPEFENNEDVRTFKSHVYSAAKLVENWKDAPADLDIVIMQHHEKPDGSGFPHGLKAEQIHPAAAILIVALDLVNFYNEKGPQADISQFISQRAKYYAQGPFRNVLSGLALSK